MQIRDPWLRALSILGCAIAGFYLVGLLWGIVQEFADIILLFFLAWLVAFVLEPLVGTLVEGQVPRLAAIGLTYLTLLVLVAAGVVLLVPCPDAADRRGRAQPAGLRRAGDGLPDQSAGQRQRLADQPRQPGACRHRLRAQPAGAQPPSRRAGSADPEQRGRLRDRRRDAHGRAADYADPVLLLHGRRRASGRQRDRGRYRCVSRTTRAFWSPAFTTRLPAFSGAR